MLRSVLVVCQQCKNTLTIQVDLEEMIQKSKGGIFSVTVPHSDHSTIFFLSFTKDNIQVRGQVTGDSMVEALVGSSHQRISTARAKGIDTLFTNFLGIAPEIQLACVLDQEGAIMGVKTALGLSNAKIDRMKTMIRQLREGVTKRSFDLISLGVSVFEMGYLRFVFSKAGSEFSLGVISNINIPVEQTLAYCYLVAEKLWRILDGRSVTLEIPILNIGEPLDAKPEMERVRYFGVKPDQYLAKLTIVGDEAVGKTSLVRRFVEDIFDSDYLSTIGVNIMTKTVRFPDEETTMLLSIHDMGGQDHFASVRKIYFRGTHACFICFDVTNRQTFENVKSWYADTMQYAGENTAVILLGNKVDLTEERVVSAEEVANLVQKLGCYYIETSAKTGENVEIAFSLITLFLCDRTETYIEPPLQIEELMPSSTHAMFQRGLEHPIDHYRVFAILIQGTLGVENVIHDLLTYLDPTYELILLLGPTAPTQLSIPKEATIGWVTTITGMPELGFSFLYAEDPSMVNVFLTKTVGAIPEDKKPIIIGDFLDNMIPHMEPSLFYKYYSDLASTARILNYTIIFIAKADIHSEANINVIKHFADVIIENREREENGKLVREARINNRLDKKQTNWEKY